MRWKIKIVALKYHEVGDDQGKVQEYDIEKKNEPGQAIIIKYRHMCVCAKVQILNRTLKFLTLRNNYFLINKS